MRPCRRARRWVDAFKENRATLHVHVVDGVSGTSACAKGKSVRVVVYLDEQPVGLTDVPCSEAIQLPAFDIPSEGRSVAVGAEIAVSIGPDDLAIGPPQVYPPKSL